MSGLPSAINSGIGGTKAISNTGGTLDIGFSAIECNQVNEVINLTGGNSYFGSTSITNTTTNGSGFLMASPAFLSLGNSGFAINTGTGYCLKGTGTIFYDRYIFSDTAAVPQNKKVQNTLIIFQYTSTASVVA
jgi:hypothetical protein